MRLAVSPLRSQTFVRVHEVIKDREPTTPRSQRHVASGHLTHQLEMSQTVRALFRFLIISIATSFVFQAWRGRTLYQLTTFHDSDDPGDPPSLVTYRGSRLGLDYRPLDSVRTPLGGDDKSGVSAVILNWSRFQNVVLIVSSMCDPSLRDVISEIIVWNNGPHGISAEVSKRANSFTTLTLVYHT